MLARSPWAAGSSHAAVSRRFVAATAEGLAGSMGRSLDGQRFLVVMLDGFRMGEHLLLGALGIGADGVKVPWRPDARSRPLRLCTGRHRTGRLDA